MRLMGLVAALLVGGLALACSSGGDTTASSGSSSSTSSSGGGGSGQGGAGGGAALTCDAQSLACDGASGCQTCARDGACKPDLDACTANPECVALNNCFGMCEAMPAAEQPACRTQCRTDHPSGATTYDAIALCVICEQCPTSCPDLAVDCP